MKGQYPKKLSKILVGDAETDQRFLKAAIGWVRYKPLLYYIKDRENYKNIMEKTRDNLKKSVSKINTEFPTCDFSCLIKEFDKYEKNVEIHYQEYKRVNELWDKLKYKIKKGK